MTLFDIIYYMFDKYVEKICYVKLYNTVTNKTYLIVSILLNYHRNNVVMKEQ